MSFSSDDGLCNECHKKPKKNEYDAWYRKYVVQAYCSVTCKESASRRKDREMAAAAMQRSVARQDVNAAPTTSRASPLQSLAQATPTATAQPRRDGALNGSPAHAQRTVDNTVIPNTVRSTGITYDAMCCKCGIRPRKTTVHVQDDCSHCEDQTPQASMSAVKQTKTYNCCNATLTMPATPPESCPICTISQIQRLTNPFGGTQPDNPASFAPSQGDSRIYPTPPAAAPAPSVDDDDFYS